VTATTYHAQRKSDLATTNEPDQETPASESTGAEKARLEKIIAEAAAAGKYDEAARAQKELKKVQNQCHVKAGPIESFTRRAAQSNTSIASYSHAVSSNCFRDGPLIRVGRSCQRQTQLASRKRGWRRCWLRQRRLETTTKRRGSRLSSNCCTSNPTLRRTP